MAISRPPPLPYLRVSRVCSMHPGHPSGNEPSSANTLGTNSTPQCYLYRHDYHHNLRPFDYAHCLCQHHTIYPRWLPTTFTISSTVQKYYFLTNHNKSSITEALLIRNIQPSINSQWTGMNRALKLFTQLPTKPTPSYSYNYLPFPSITTYPTNCPQYFLTSLTFPALYPNK